MIPYYTSFDAEFHAELQWNQLEYNIFIPADVMVKKTTHQNIEIQLRCHFLLRCHFQGIILSSATGYTFISYASV